jgi:hypothetical protein
VASDGEQISLLRTLIVLTLVSGLVDAVSYLGLGRVFTANMTGNVVVLGFAAAGAPGFSVTASLTSLGVFLVGAVTAGRASKRITGRRRLLITAMATEAILVGAAAVVAYLASTVGTGWGRYTVIALLAFAMGVRNAVIRHLAVHDRADPDPHRPGRGLQPRWRHQPQSRAKIGGRPGDGRRRLHRSRAVPAPGGSTAAGSCCRGDSGHGRRVPAQPGVREAGRAVGVLGPGRAAQHRDRPGGAAP